MFSHMFIHVHPRFLKWFLIKPPPSCKLKPSESRKNHDWSKVFFSPAGPLWIVGLGQGRGVSCVIFNIAIGVICLTERDPMLKYLLWICILSFASISTMNAVRNPMALFNLTYDKDGDALGACL